MRIIIFIILFFPLKSFSYNDSTKFINNIHLELNCGIGKIRYFEYYQSPSGSDLIQFDDVSINFSGNLFYKIKRFSLGFSCQYLHFTDDSFASLSPFLEFNILDIVKNKNLFFGPRISYGYIIRGYNNTTLSRFSMGMSFHYKKFHIGINYDWIKPNYNSIFYIKPRNIFLEIGYAFNLETFRKKK